MGGEFIALVFGFIWGANRAEKSSAAPMQGLGKAAPHGAMAWNDAGSIPRGRNSYRQSWKQGNKARLVIKAKARR